MLCQGLEIWPNLPNLASDPGGTLFSPSLLEVMGVEALALSLETRVDLPDLVVGPGGTLGWVCRHLVSHNQAPPPTDHQARGVAVSPSKDAPRRWLGLGKSEDG